MRRPKGFDWGLTRRVRDAVRDDRVLVSPHAEAKLPPLGLHVEDLVEVLRSGVVLGRCERDERRTAIDGYKHFLQGLSPSGRIYEVVFKLVGSVSGVEELVVLITLYRGMAR